VAFLAVFVVCVLGAVVAISRGGTSTSGGAAADSDDVSVASVGAGPHAVLVDTRLGGGFGHVALVDLSAPDRIADTDLVCDRVDMVGDRGVCLRADRGVLTTYQAVVFDDQFQTVATYDLSGIPSRTRVSPDGTYGAWTTFVSGDSYLSQGLSTRTHIVNLRTGETAGDLEKFLVFKDGAPFSEVDFNFWGVTFDGADPNAFYATLSTGGHVYLVRGDLAARRLDVVHDGVECPSLSPDGKRIAYKKRVTGDMGRTEWRLAVLDLATMTSHDLPGDRNVDDQVQWLDDEIIAFGVPQADAGTPTKDTYRVAADGASPPELLVSGAWSLGPTER
jgi:hypothetical protein